MNMFIIGTLGLFEVVQTQLTGQ